MAWRLTELLIEGILDNTAPGKVTGWMQFAGQNGKVTLDLQGDFHRDIRGAKLRLRGDGESANIAEAKKYLEEFSIRQTGKVGDMTAGKEPVDYVSYPYIEFYSDDNGRVVIELDSDQVEILSPPIPACESDPIDRNDQAENMAGFLGDLASGLGLSENRAVAIGQTVAVEQAKKVISNDKIRGMKLLTKEIREQLPPLYSQDGKGGKTIAYVKYFIAGWTWYATEYDGEDTFFGLVEGREKELGYFSLSELQQVKGPLGLPIERDLYFKPTPLEAIAPELFTTNKKKEGD